MPTSNSLPQSTTIAESQITGDITIAELKQKHPEIVEYLSKEYEFHCFSCFLAPLETLRQGCLVHGLSEADFEEMLVDINKRVFIPLIIQS